MNDFRDMMNKIAFLENEEPLNEVKPLGRLGKAATGAMAKLGSQKAERKQAAGDMAEKIYAKWEEDSKKGDFTPSIQLLARWLEKRNIDADVIQASFKGIGVDDVAQYMKPEEAPDSAIMKWLEDEMIQPGALNGSVAKEYLLDKGVPEERAVKMLDRIGVEPAGNKIVSAEQREKLDVIVQKFGSAQKGDDEPQVSSQGDEGETPTADWPASKVYDYVLNKYEIEEERLSKAFTDLGTDAASEEPIGDEALAALTKAIADNVPEKETSDETGEEGGEDQDPEAVMDKTQDIMKQYGSTVGKSVQAGKKAAKVGDFSNMTELQKLGLAVLTARKKI